MSEKSEPTHPWLLRETEKRKILAPGTEEGPWTLTQLLEGKGRSVVYVETEKSIYVANDLDTAMQLWKTHATLAHLSDASKYDDSKVINVSRLG